MCRHKDRIYAIRFDKLEGKVYIRPPEDFPHKKGDLWELLKPPYGTSEYECQWLL